MSIDSMRVNSAGVKVDEDINIENVSCDIMRALLDRYSSFFVGDSEYDTDIYLYDRRGFLTFDYASMPLYPRIEKREDYDQFETDDMVPFVSTLKCVYTIQMFRKYGNQERMFREIMDLAEATGKGFVAWASPFKLVKTRYEKSGCDAMLSMVIGGYENHPDYKIEQEKQKKRFERYGMKNFWNEHSESNSDAWFVYMPTTAPYDHKKTIKTLLR